ncbi:succinyl-diaminopimelate desuccinylase [Rickettsiales bacterium]|nr:succinyl-diaminopimelate desuccinylase [Rickettsiales bacterium]MDB2550593.1 succinyl-diaminopimelate desuccinylase [Rickettsiales bacterium]
MSYLIEFTQKLIQQKSITGQKDKGAIDFLSDKLKNLGFDCQKISFSDDKSYDVDNLHAILNPKNSDKILYFAGHTDVVPTGDLTKWQFDPFSATIFEEKLYGRGIVDMKGAIAAFIIAIEEFLAKKELDFGVGFLITGDEEGDAVNGTKKMLNWMGKNNQKMSHCIVGEPTNPEKTGQMVKIGRRGSINFEIKLIGKQGHVAYPHNALNPITELVNVLKILKDYKLDDGNKYFDPSNLEITHISNDIDSSNVISGQANARFNIRFNDEWNSQKLIDWVKYILDHSAIKYELNYRISGESFLSDNKELQNILINSIKNITGKKPELSTTGGTSDARFIKDYAAVIECGLVNKTAHQIDENIEISEITLLKDIYLEILNNYNFDQKN